MTTALFRSPWLACALIALASAARPQAEPSVPLQATRIGDYDAEVGRLEVPENRSSSESRSIRLAFARLKSTAEDPGPPLFMLPGGPGNAATPMAASPVWERFLALGDVVLMDPRAVERSEPDLSWSSDELRPELFFIDRETAVGLMERVCAAAVQDLAASGADLAGYTAIEMADDVDALRRALGYEQVHVMGHSFGTLLGLALLRRHPGTVARFVSVGTAGPGDMMKLPADLDRSLETLSRIVAQDPNVGAEVPDLRALLERVLDRLREEPLSVPIRAADGSSREVLLGSFGLQLLLVADLGDTADLVLFPRLLTELDAGETRTVSWFLQKRIRQFAQLPTMMLAVRASAGADASRWKQIREQAQSSPFGLARCMFSPESDGALGVRDVGDAFRAPVESDVPTLLISGTLDAHTPPFQAERVRRGLSRSGHVVVEFGGHEDLMPDPRVQELILAFFAGERPRDVTLEREPLRFAALRGADPTVDHPALR